MEHKRKRAVPKERSWKSFKLVEDNAQTIEHFRADKRKTDATTVIGIGRELWEAHEKLAHYGDGVFGKWRRDRLKLRETQARRFMCVAQVFGDFANLAQTFEVSALYELAKPGVPKQAVEEALAVAKRRVEQAEAVAKEAEANGDESPEVPPAPITRQRALVLIERAWNKQPKPKSNKAKTMTLPPQPTTLDRLKNLWEQATSQERADFKAWVKQRMNGLRKAG